MFGIIRHRKPFIHEQWFVPLLDFESNTEMFYKAIEDDLLARQVPELTVERINFKQRGWFSANRAYLRLRKQVSVLEVCSASFGTGWWFSLRSATLPRNLYWWEVGVTLLGLAGFSNRFSHFNNKLILVLRNLQMQFRGYSRPTCKMQNFLNVCMSF